MKRLLVRDEERAKEVMQKVVYDDRGIPQRRKGRRTRD